MVDKMSIKYQMARKYQIHAANSMEIPKILRSVEICLNNYKHMRQKISDESTPSTSTHSTNAFQETVYSDDNSDDMEINNVEKNDQNALVEQNEQQTSMAENMNEDEDWRVFMKKPNNQKYISTKQMDPHVEREHPIGFPHFKTKEPPIQRFNLDIKFEPGFVVLCLTIKTNYLTTTYFGVQYYVYKDQKAPRAEWSQQIKCMSTQNPKVIFKCEIKIGADRFLPGQRIVFLTITGYVGFQRSGFSLPFVIYIDRQRNYECNYNTMKEQANQLQ